MAVVEAGYGHNRGYSQGFASPTAPSLGHKHRDQDSGDDEPQGMFTVVIDSRPWKEFTSNKAFSVAKTLATKHPNKKIQVQWPSGELNTIAENIMNEDIMGAAPPESNHEATMALSELYRNAKYGMALLKIIENDDAIDGWVQANLTSAASMLDKVYHYLDYKNINGRKPEMEDIDEDDNVDDTEESDTDGSMARENLGMIVEYSIKLMEMIKPGDNLASWVSMKLTKASEAVSSSKHFIEYRQFEKHSGDMMESRLVRMLVKQLAEDTETVADFLARGGKIQQGKPQKGPRKPGLSMASKHIGGGGEKMKASRNGKGANTSGKPVVSTE
jgi:hypothetical protein